MDKKSLLPAFADLLVSLTVSGLNSHDDFLLDSVRAKLAELLKHLVNFVQTNDKSAYAILDFQLKSVLSIFAIFFHFKKITPLDFLTVQKNILSFQKSLLDFGGTIKKKEVKQSTKDIHSNRGVILAPLKKSILVFIDKEGETLNLDVFNHFHDISKRTLKRHLSDLIAMGYIQRESQGKKVYYKKPVISIRNMSEEAQS